MNNYNPIVDDYIYGELDADEMLNFERLIATDTQVESEFQLYKQINDAILEEDVMMLRGSLDEIYTEISVSKQKDNSSIFSNRKLYYAAASLALLVATGGVIRQIAKTEHGTDSIYSKYFVPYDVSVSYRSGNEEIDRLLVNALEKYEDHDYQNAVLLFEKVLEKRSNDMAANLYSGISLMETDKYQKASKSFQNIITNNNNLFIEQAKWYLAMCYIKTHNTSKAEEILKELVTDDSYYKKLAQKVLNDLD